MRSIKLKAKSNLKFFNPTSIILFCITVTGFAFRIYRFPYIPKFTDEVREALLAYDIYTLSSFPLTNYTSYIGSLYLYVLAVFSWITPLSIWTPRILSLLAGIILIPLVYYMAKLWSNKYVGLLSALYVAVSPTLILINSRIAWSNVFTPLITVLTLIQLKRVSIKYSLSQYLILGILLGISIQLHPLMLIFALTVFLSTLLIIIYNFHAKIIVISKLYFLKIFLIITLGILIGILPLLIANILSPLESIKDGIAKDNFSAEMLTPTLFEYSSRMSLQLAQTRHLIRQAVIFDTYVIPSYEYYSYLFAKSFSDIFMIFVLIGNFAILIKKKWELLIFPLIIGVFLILAPLLTDGFFEGLKIRYYSFLIPLIGFIISYGLFVSWGLLRKYISKYLLFMLYLAIIGGMCYIPLKNYFNFLLSYKENIHDVYKDIDKLKKYSSSYTLKYIDPDARGNGTPYSIVLFLMEYGRVDQSNLYPVEDVYVQSERSLLIMPKGVLGRENEVFAEKILNGKFEKIDAGMYIEVYK